MPCPLLISFLVCLVSLGGAVSIYGKSFLITFQENETFGKKAPESQCVTLTTILENNIAVQVTSLDPDINFNTNVIINNTLSEYVCLDNTIQLKGTGLSRKVVKVSSDNEISVMVDDIEAYSCDSYVAIPVENYGTNYYVMSYWDESQFSVTGIENDTIVIIEFPIRNNTFLNFEVNYGGVTVTNPSTIALTIHEHEVYQLTMAHDLTGVFISASKPVAVISGNKKIAIYESESGQDHLAEQMPPVDTWGTHFISVPSPDKIGTDLYTILASASTTSVNVRNITYLLQTKGNFIRISLPSTGAFAIISDKPVLVVKTTTKYDNVNQCMMLIVPQGQWLNYYSFHFPQVANLPGYLILVVESQFKTSILLNQEPLNISQWIEVENSDFSVGYLLLPNALYTLHLSESNGYFAAYIQHSHRMYPYCTSVGMKLVKINMGWQSNFPLENATSSTTETVMSTESTSESTPRELTTTTFPASSPVATKEHGSYTSETTEPLPKEKKESCFNPNSQLLNLSVTDGVFLDILEELKQHLKVVSQKTSKAIRKKISVPDPRPSSTTIGMSWWIVVVVLFTLGTLLTDTIKILSDIRFGTRKPRPY